MNHSANKFGGICKLRHSHWVHLLTGLNAAFRLLIHSAHKNKFAHTRSNTAKATSNSTITMKFSLRSSNKAQSRNDASLRSSASSTATNASSSSSSRKSKPEFVAESMKEMDPFQVIEMLEMYADTADSNYAFDCFQSLKNSAPPSKNEKSRASAA